MKETNYFYTALDSSHGETHGLSIFNVFDMNKARKFQNECLRFVHYQLRILYNTSTRLFHKEIKVMWTSTLSRIYEPRLITIG